MSTVAGAVRANVHAPVSLARAPLRVALLGVGQVGGAVAALLRQSPISGRATLISGLVRDLARERPHAAGIRLTASLGHALGDRADVVIEALGGLEPARTLVLTALERGIPVATANKSLLAAHGDLLLDTAARAGVPLRYEAAVLAGVPFLGTFARRSFARDLTGFCGIVNGTTNFILSKMALEHIAFDDALGEAQRLGYAEPDPASDVEGVDATEKLCILLRHFGEWSVAPGEIASEGITAIEARDLRAAADLGGTVKPVVHADWQDGQLTAFAGPAFVAASHPLARVNGVQNAVLLRNRTAGELFFAGPGAGPSATAATLLDDVEEIAAELEGGSCAAAAGRNWKRSTPGTGCSGWFVRLSGERLPDQTAVADLLSSYGIWVRRTAEQAGDSFHERWFITYECVQPQIATALAALNAAAGCRSSLIRVLEH